MAIDSKIVRAATTTTLPHADRVAASAPARPVRKTNRISLATIEQIVEERVSAMRPPWTITSEIHARLNDGRVSLEGLNWLIESVLFDNDKYPDTESKAHRIHYVLSMLYTLMR